MNAWIGGALFVGMRPMSEYSVALTELSIGAGQRGGKAFTRNYGFTEIAMGVAQ